MNKHPEQIARDDIDRQLRSCGWVIQDKSGINLNASLGVAIREYQTAGPADYVLFVEGKPVGVIEAKREEEAETLTVHEEQVEGYAKAKLKYLNNEILPFVYLSTGSLTRLTDFREPKPRAREVFTFCRPETIYKLLKKNKSLRSFLLDLGEQAEQEFMSYQPNDDNRKFTEPYGVHRLKSRYIPDDNHVYISTIQRLYAVLRGQDLEESAEEENPHERWQPKEVPPVEYNEKLPIEYFDFIVIDECHRSIYNLWMQVLDYFDAFQIGLTATPDKRTFAYFQQNIVSEYSHEMAVADGVNVGYDVFLIDTKITQKGSTLWKGAYIEHRERLSRRKRLELQDEDETYSSQQLDKDIVNPNQIRTIIRTFKEHLPQIFPDRYDKDGVFEVPKTLIFAKTDSHADDIIEIVRQEFYEENRFCKKLTYKSNEDPKSILAQFRNDYHPRIAVTVDMIATGTDVKPLECLIFMRDVKSRNYFEQMEGRGTRVINFDDLKKVSPSARVAKDHFVIIDAIGVTKSLKTDSRPLEKKPGVPLKDLLNAYNPDILEALCEKVETEMHGAAPFDKGKKYKELETDLQNKAARIFRGELNKFIENVRKIHEQKIDILNPDELICVGWDKENKEKASEIAKAFREWVEELRGEITALQIFYSQPYRRRELTFAMIKELVEKILLDKPVLAPMKVWRAYEQLEAVTGQPKNEMVALVSLIRRVAGIDNTLTPYDKTVDINFRKGLFKKQAGPLKFTKEQMEWLYMLKEHIAVSVHVDIDDLDYTPFDAKGGRGRMWQLFGDSMNTIIDELNEALAA